MRGSGVQVTLAAPLTTKNYNKNNTLGRIVGRETTSQATFIEGRAPIERQL